MKTTAIAVYLFFKEGVKLAALLAAGAAVFYAAFGILAFLRWVGALGCDKSGLTKKVEGWKRTWEIKQATKKARAQVAKQVKDAGPVAVAS